MLIRLSGISLGAALLWPCQPALQAQSSAYVPLDDARLPLVEHLITRGVITDPAPMVRPFRRSDLLLSLDSARAPAGSADADLVARLLREYRADTAEARWRLEARAGAQGYQNARQDMLLPAGPGGVRPYADLGLTANFGPVVAVTRPALEPRVTDDPAWPGRTDLDVAFRMREAYLSGQFKWFRLMFGDLQRSWGPVGAQGIPLSDYSYPRTHWQLYLGKPSINLMAVSAQLRDDSDSTGAVIHRYWFGHRLSFKLGSSWDLALWETTVLAGEDQNFDDRFRNPVSLLLLANTYGLGTEGNTMVGLDLRWRAGPRITLEGQIAVDDLQYQNRSGPDRFPDRWGVTVAGYGPLGNRLAWRSAVTVATSLAFRAQNPFESFVDAGVGIGRSVADNLQWLGEVSLPLEGWLLLRPRAIITLQGQGRLNDPIPANPGQVPQLFIGTRQDTYRLAVAASGRRGIMDLSAEAGVNHVRNADHVAGSSRTEFQGRIQLTVGLFRQGRFR